MLSIQRCCSPAPTCLGWANHQPPRRFVTQVGPLEAADRVARSGIPPLVAAETCARRAINRAMADLDAAAAVGAHLLIPDHPHSPHARLAPLAEATAGRLAPPLALWVRGPARLDELCQPAVASVWPTADTPVVSGAALGIDGAAHRGVLAVDGSTVAILRQNQRRTLGQRRVVVWWSTRSTGDHSATI